jgi:hypothetical protein
MTAGLAWHKSDIHSIHSKPEQKRKDHDHTPAWLYVAVMPYFRTVKWNEQGIRDILEASQDDRCQPCSSVVDKSQSKMHQ